MSFPWVKDLARVIVLRKRRSPKDGGTQNNSTIIYHEGDDSISVDMPSAFPSSPSSSSRVQAVSGIGEPGLGVSTTVTSTRSSCVVSPAREASDMAQLSLPVLHAVAGAIPLAGALMQAAIGGLLAILQAIDVRTCLFARAFFDFKGRHREVVRIRRTYMA